jgi:hypothetical protein
MKYDATLASRVRSILQGVKNEIDPNENEGAGLTVTFSPNLETIIGWRPFGCDGEEAAASVRMFADTDVQKAAECLVSQLYAAKNSNREKIA